MVQPDKFMDALRHPSLRESGLLARILPVKPASMIGQRFEEPNDPGLDESVMAQFRTTINSILGSSQPIDPRDGTKKPHVARLSPEAAEARRLWHNAVEAAMSDGGELETCRDIASKAVSQVVKLALVLHLLEEPGCLQAACSEIRLETWKAAQQLGEFFLETAVEFRALAGRDRIDTEAARLAEWLRKSGRRQVTARDIARNGPRPRLDAKTLAAVLDELLADGFLRRGPANGEFAVTREAAA